MPDLVHSLQGQDLGHLRIVAELWGLELSAPEAQWTVESLAAAMLDRQQLDELLQALPKEAQEALAEMLPSGRLPWRLFTRRYGAVREMGAGRRDRARPHLDPISPAEMLWYRGLVGRAFFDTPNGAQEFAYIPDDLIPLLPASPGAAALPLGHPAVPAARAHPFPASDRILDEACTLLAALRLGLPLEQLESYPPQSPYPLSLASLITLLKAAGLLDSQDLPLPEPVRAFLEAERGEALAQLGRAWLESAEFNELALIPQLSLDGEWANDPLRARRAILDFLGTLPKDTWWSLPAFIEVVRQRHPDFQRPAGDYDSWFIRERRSGEYLRGFAHWEAVDGELIRFVITGPMYWLGMIDLAAPAPGEMISAFRYSRWSEALLLGFAPQSLSKEEEKALVRSDGRLSLPRLVPRAVRYQVARFCAWEGQDGQAYRYRLTPASLERAHQQGLRLDHLLALLKRQAEAVPPNLVKALKRWEENGTQAYIERLLVLRLSSPEVLQALRDSRAARFLGDPLGPTAVIVKPGAWEKVMAFLIELGYLAEAQIEK